MPYWAVFVQIKFCTTFAIPKTRALEGIPAAPGVVQRKNKELTPTASGCFKE